MVGNQDADVQVLQFIHDLLDILHSNGVYTSKGFVEHDKLWFDGQTTGNLSTTALTTRKTITQVLAHLLQAELGNQFLELLQLVVTGLLHAHLTEHARLLGQIADTSPGTLIHGELRHFLVAQVDMTTIGHNQARSHIKRGGLAGTVGAQQSYNLTLLHVEAHIIDHRTLTIALHEAFCP